MKRPIGAYVPSDNVPSNGSYKQQGRNDYDQYGYGNQYGGQQGQSNRDYGSSPQDRRARNKMNADGGGSTAPSMPSQKSSAPQATEKQAEKMDTEKQKAKEAADKKEKDEKAAPFKNALRSLERYNDMVDQNSFNDYVSILNKSQNMFEEFEKTNKLPITAETPSYLRSGFVGPLTLEQSQQKSDPNYLKTYLRNETAKPHFKDNTKAARVYHEELKEPFSTVKPHLTEMKDALDATRKNLDKLSIQDLNNLKSSQALVNIKKRFQAYEKHFNEVQKELHNKHKMHKIESENSSDYDKLEQDIMNMHGLTKLIDDTKYAINSLERSIHAEIKQRQREGNKS